ncbi:MAG: hypothetical protein ACOYOK_06560 [Pseudobdellovibrionaceae bacterium]
MKISIIVFTIVILFSPLTFSKVKMNTVYDGKIPTKDNYRIKLEIPIDWNADADPGEFTTLIILKNGKAVFTQTDLQGSKLENVGEFPIGTQLLGKYMKVFSIGPKLESQFILAASNWSGPEADQLILISLSDKQPKILFRQSIDKAAIRDFDGDGLLARRKI